MNINLFSTGKIGVRWNDDFTLPYPLEGKNRESEGECYVLVEWVGKVRIHPLFNLGGVRNWAVFVTFF